VIEIQGKTKTEPEAARIQLSSLIQEWGSQLFFGVVEIPRGLHRFVVGKGGQNIAKMKAAPVWEGRLVDVTVPNESDDSDEVILVVQRRSLGLASAPKAKAPKPGHVNQQAVEEREAEVQAFAEKVRDEILAVARTQADFTTEVLAVSAKYHGRLIGAGGEKLKELLTGYGDDVSVKFPYVAKGDSGAGEALSSGKKSRETNVDPDTVTVRGPKKAVAEIKKKIEGLVAELKHIEVISSFTEFVKVKKGLGKKLMQGAGAPFSLSGGSERTSNGIGWLIRAVREAIAAAPVPHHGKASAGDVTADQAILNLRVEIEEAKTASGEDVLTIIGPKNAVFHAKKIVADRAVRLADQIVSEVKLFEDITKEARSVLAENSESDELKRRVLRRLIGKEGRGVKAIMEKHAVHLQFPDDKRKRKGGKKGASQEDLDEGDEENTAIEENTVLAPDALVIIKGNAKDSEAAKKEILSIVESEVMLLYFFIFDLIIHVTPFFSIDN
jgi:hypothetical protein